jgi:hypothetical protein
MKLSLYAASAAICISALAGCATSDDNLINSVPVGSGTSRSPIYDFSRCATQALGAQATQQGQRLRMYSSDADGQIITVRGAGGKAVVLLLAEPSATGTGYTIYGDIAAANRYVAAAHTCD